MDFMDFSEQNFLEHLNTVNKINKIPIYSIESKEFISYGRILKGYDFSPLINFMQTKTSIPESGNIYVASVNEMEEMPICKILESSLYGGMKIQIGYCNGKNSTFNGFEYHKGSEINIAVSDFMISLGHVWQIQNNHFNNNNAKVFYVKQGTAFEMYQTTLHLSPLKICDSGFKGIVILPKGTNSPLSQEEKSLHTKDPENQLLLQKNKWVISHPNREALIKQGAFPGIIGENIEVFY